MLNLTIGQGPLIDIISNFFYAMCILNIALGNWYSLNEILIVWTTLLLTFVISIFSGDYQFLYLLLVMLSVKNVDLDGLLKLVFLIQVFSYVLILIFNYLGIIESRIVYRDGGIRNSLGFWHPNTTGALLLSIFLIMMYLTRRKKFLFPLLLINIANYYINVYAQSRTSQGLIIFASVLFMVNWAFEKLTEDRQSKMLNWFVRFLFPVMIFFSVILCFLYARGSNWLIEMNRYLSGRLNLGLYFLKNYKLSLFGQKVLFASPNSSQNEVVGLTYLVLDNAFLKLLVSKGIAACLILSGYYYLLFAKFLNNRQSNILALIVIVFLLFAFNEQVGLTFEFNFTLLFSSVLFKNYGMSSKEVYIS